MTSTRYLLITFLRDPLEVKLSLYRFERERGVGGGPSVEEHLFERSNYLASILPATDADYRQILDRYAFVGILEQAQESVDRLADFLGKPRGTLPLRNRSRGPLPEISGEIAARFRKDNELDYAIYEYGQDRLAREINEAGSPL